MNEQLLKRLQDSLKMLSVCLEQLTEVGWLIHDIIEDLELEVSPGQVAQGVSPGAKDVKEGALNT
jgi:hypothetical protein